MDESLRLEALGARAQIASGTLRGARLLERILAVPAHDRDAYTDVMLGFEEAPPDVDLPRGAVPYLPCGVEEIVAVLGQVALGPTDELVDLGSGLGRVAILVHLVSGAGTRGLEIQKPLVQLAEARCKALALTDVTFEHADATCTDLEGTVFFLYAPFNGALLRAALERLEEVARRHPIVVCTVGLELREVGWLQPRPSALLSLSVYDSRG